MTTTGAQGDLSEYYQQSAEQCCCNQSCQCCTCRCCGLFILICWIIFGAWGAYSSYAGIQATSDWYVSTDCAADTDGSYTGSGDCCVATVAGFGGGDDTVFYYEPNVCNTVKTGYTIGLVQNILACIAGVVGTVGMVMFITYLLLVPLGYAILSIIFDIIGIALIGLTYVGGYLSAAIGVLIAILFFKNWKLMKDFVQK